MHIPERLLSFFTSARFEGHFEPAGEAGGRPRLHGVRPLTVLQNLDQVHVNQFELGWLAGACPAEFELTMRWLGLNRLELPASRVVGRLLGAEVVLVSSEVAVLDLHAGLV